MAKDYSKLSKEELIKMVEKLDSRKKYGLIWDEEKVKEQFEKDAQNALPVLKEIKGKEIADKDLSKPVNILIEGDNYHALSVLNFTHQGKIDVIYIDPPYNTGAKDWRYNNDYVDVTDSYRHSKWLSMMQKRLFLAKNLLNEGGILMIAIDDHEVHNLRHLLNEIMGEENYISTICIEVNPAGQNIRDNAPAISHDYCLIYAKSIDKAKLILRELSEDESLVFKEHDDNGNYLWDNLRRRGGNSTPKDRPGQSFPLFINSKSKKISLERFPGCIEVWPIDPKGIKRIWRVNPDGFLREYAAGNISVIEKAGRLEIVKKSYEPVGRKPKTIWKEARHSATSHGTKLLIEILGGNSFNYPKSLYLVKDCLRYWSGPEGIVLDFFAGSGTTGHAVMELNKEDDGNRSFILCTNNENGICEDVTYPRVKKVISGHKNSKGESVIGLGGSLKYFKTKFVKLGSNTDDFKTRITNECTEMLCLREGVFNEIKKTASYHIFQQGEKTLAVYYSLKRDSLPTLKKELDKIEGEKTLYCFTLDPVGLSKTEFAGWHGVTLEPIPQKILDVYKQIYEY